MEIVWQTPANPPERHGYIFLNGRRYVKPYYFQFISRAKNRWAGKKIVDLFAEEFKARPFEYYVSAVNSGRIQVDGLRVVVSYVVQPSQKISHFLHRFHHPDVSVPPVIALDVSILQKEADVLTVCNLHLFLCIHVVNIVRTQLLAFFKLSMVWHLSFIESGKVKKQYIANVIGVFLEGEQFVNANVNHDAREGRSTTAMCLSHCRYDRSEEGLWLHCVRCSGPDWVYECPYPYWAFLG